jgi:hypothetical protein
MRKENQKNTRKKLMEKKFTNSQIHKRKIHKFRNQKTYIRIDQLLISLDHQTQKHCKILGTLGVSIIYDLLHKFYSSKMHTYNIAQAKRCNS